MRSTHALTMPRTTVLVAALICLLVIFNIVPVFAAPPNDDLAFATVITAVPYNGVVDTTGTTQETNELEVTCGDTLGSVWWTFSPTVSGNYQIDTSGTELPIYDTLLSLYDDAAADHPLNEINCNDDYSGDALARFIHPLYVGTQYTIRAADNDDSGNFEVGNMHLNVTLVGPPFNDDLANATTITSLPYSDVVNTTGMTEEANESEPSMTCGDTLGSVWWTFTPTDTGMYSIDTNGSQSPVDDTLLSVYTAGSSTHPLDEINCDDEGGEGSNSRIELELTANTQYYIRVADFDNAGNLDVGNVHLNVFGPPANDNIANATNITAVPYTNTVNSNLMTEEPNEIDPSLCGVSTLGSLWWSFTPPVDGNYQIDTFDSAYPADNTVLSVYTGTFPALNELACNDQSLIGSNSVLTLNLTTTETYYIRVADNGDDASLDVGDVTLHITNLDVAPINDDFANALIIAPTAEFYSSTINTANMTEETDEPVVCVDTAGSVWWTFTPATDGVYIIDTFDSESPADNTVLSVHTGTLGALTLVDCNDDSAVSGGLDSSLMPTLAAGVQYYIRVADYDDVGSGVPDTGNIHLYLTFIGTPPANDDLSNAIDILPSQIPFSLIDYDITAASIEGAEQFPDCIIGDDGSVWWSFTPTVTGSYLIDTFDPDFDANDTTLSVFEGSAYGSLTQRACNDDEEVTNDITSAVEVELTANVTYSIRIGVYACGCSGFPEGSINLNISLIERPINDDVANAIIIDPSALPYNSVINTDGASLEANEEYEDCATTEGSLWWSITPTVDGYYVIDTLNSPEVYGDTVLSIYTGTPTHPLTLVDCNDDAFDPLQSELRLPLDANVTYYIRVAAYVGQVQAGFFTLNVNEVPPPVPPANDDLANAFTADPVLFYSTSQDISYATLEGAEEFPTCVETVEGGDHGSVWWTFTPPVTGNYQIDTYDPDAQNDTTLAVYEGSTYGALNQIACNQDADAGASIYTSLVQVPLTGGVTYRIRIGAYSCECGDYLSGTVNLNINFLDVVVTISPQAMTLAENSSTQITVTRFGDTSFDLDVQLNITGDADTNDYELINNATLTSQSGSSTITILSGSDTATFDLNVKNDDSAEPENMLMIALVDDVTYDLGSPSAFTLTIPREDLGVTNLNSSGEGSLAQAIDNANNFGGSNEIFIPAGTILVNPTLYISSDLTLTGDSTATTILSGSGTQVLNITSGTVLLRGFTIRDGVATHGGGVAVTNASVTIGNDPIIISGNTATTCGGGLYVGTGGNVNVQAGSQIFSNSTTANGGGICVEDGTLTVTGPNTAVYTNHAANGVGGGIFLTGASASVTVQGVASVSENDAANGGGIYQNEGSLYIVDSLIQSNLGIGGDGAIRFSANNLRSVTNTCIVNNTDTSVTFAGGTDPVIGTGNWWGSAAGPFSNSDTPNPPNDGNTLYSTGDSVSYSGDPTVFDYSSYLSTPPHAGCLVCQEVSGVGQGSVCNIN